MEQQIKKDELNDETLLGLTKSRCTLFLVLMVEVETQFREITHINP
jgi:hypothetical protein